MTARIIDLDGARAHRAKLGKEFNPSIGICVAFLFGLAFWLGLLSCWWLA
jgi:hypothetical protein